MSSPVNMQPRGRDIRVNVNPNAYHGDDPGIYVARFADARPKVPAIHEDITVVQPDDDPSEPPYVSTAEVVDIDSDAELIFLRVDWKGFHDESIPSAVVNYVDAQFVSSPMHRMTVDAVIDPAALA